MPHDFDSIILGAGASGLSLAYAMAGAGLSDHRVLLVERQTQRRNDRTWSFWETSPGPFDHLVHRRWDHVWVCGDGLERRFDIGPHAYKMIRGADFYAFMDDWVARQPNITRVHGEAHDLSDAPDGASVRVGDREYTGRHLFSSLYRPTPTPAGYHHLLQHFKGWVIETDAPAFDVQAAHLMDFRVPQPDGTRFVYVLPLSATQAMVEYTLFSPELLPDHEYDAALREYIRDRLGLSGYRILEVEQGVIPMTDAPFEAHPSPHVWNIGTAGGCTKASTGYTFRRIQAQAQALAQSLAITGTPGVPKTGFDRHQWMDSVFLHVLERGWQPGHKVFTDLFKRNPIRRVLDFLNEDTGFAEELALMATMNTPVFVRAGLEVIGTDTARALGRKPRGARAGAKIEGTSGA